jgi:hypothetical protein
MARPPDISLPNGGSGRDAKRTHALSDLLGDDHDLAKLRLSVEQRPDSFEEHGTLVAQIALIERRRDQLQRQGFALGRKLYRRSPKRFVKAIERGWRKRVRPEAAAA